MAARDDDWIPEDTFGARLGMVRTFMGWNVLQAATASGLDKSSWTNWERGVSKPRDMEAVARKVSKATGCSYQWLMLGGELSRSR